MSLLNEGEHAGSPLRNFFIITPLTIHHFRTFRRIRRHHLRPTFITPPLKEFPRIPESHPVQMTLIWMSAWNWKVMFAVKFELLFDNPEWLLGDFTLDCPIEDIVRDLRNIVR